MKPLFIVVLSVLAFFSFGNVSSEEVKNKTKSITSSSLSDEGGKLRVTIKRYSGWPDDLKRGGIYNVYVMFSADKKIYRIGAIRSRSKTGIKLDKLTENSKEVLADVKWITTDKSVSFIQTADIVK